jgi:hypothetical protein
MSKAAEAVASTDYLGMSDEDFLKVNAPEATASAAAVTEKTDEEKAAEAKAAEDAATAAAAAEAAAVTKTPEEIAAEEAAATEAAKVAKAKEDADAAALAADPVAKAAADAKAEADAVLAAAGDPDKNKTKTEKKKAKAEQAAASAAKPAEAEADKTKTPEQIAAEKVAAEAAEKAKLVPKPEELTSFYNSLIGTPIKANGKSITLKSPEEVLRLVQMGAGYGRKLQDLQPHLKVIRMLEKAELLDEGKISFLIDINSKNPDAIKKIIKDSGIDPLDINTGDNVSYIPKSHAVSDQEMAFQNALGDIQAHEGGQETLKEIDQKWDNESKQVLFKEPGILGIIQTQRDNGVYAQITAEVDRQKLLGTIPNSTPFLQAYKIAGDKLFPPTQVQTTQPIQPQPVVTPQPQVIATRVEAPKAQVQNSAQAAAAAAPKGTSVRKPAPLNPLAMADEDFMKAFSGRL